MDYSSSVRAEAEYTYQKISLAEEMEEDSKRPIKFEFDASH